MSEAVPYILAELGLAPSDESERIESHRVAIDVKNISNTLTERGYSNLEQTKEYDPINRNCKTRNWLTSKISIFMVR